MNVITDALQRTCTGTINIDIQNVDGDDRTNTQANTTDTNTGREESTSSTNYETSTIYAVSQQVDSTPYQNGEQVPLFADNVHFGPAGIGLLIMGFLVLGCEYFSKSYVYVYPKNWWGKRYIF